MGKNFSTAIAPIASFSSLSGQATLIRKAFPRYRGISDQGFWPHAKFPRLCPVSSAAQGPIAAWTRLACTRTCEEHAGSRAGLGRRRAREVRGARLELPDRARVAPCSLSCALVHGPGAPPLVPACVPQRLEHARTKRGAARPS